MSLMNCSAVLLVSLSLLCSCNTPRILLKENARFDTLNLQLDVRLIQDYEYRQAIESKLQKFVTVYNTEEHPFRLSLKKETQPANCSIVFLRSKFISKKQSHVAAGVTAAGVATAVWLVSSRFFVPLGWVYIPNAKTTIQPSLSSAITELSDFPRVTIASTGMYRTKEKQIELQSNKVLTYIIQMVQHLEREYQSGR